VKACNGTSEGKTLEYGRKGKETKTGSSTQCKSTSKKNHGIYYLFNERPIHVEGLKGCDRTGVQEKKIETGACRRRGRRKRRVSKASYSDRTIAGGETPVSRGKAGKGKGEFITFEKGMNRSLEASLGTYLVERARGGGGELVKVRGR